jgi:hypothetical protein
MYKFEAIYQEIPKETRLSLSKFFVHEPMGEIALDWVELIRKVFKEKLEIIVFKIYKEEEFIGIAILSIIRKLDPEKYLWKPVAKFLKIFVQFDVGFLEIPLLNMPGLLTVKEIDKFERGSIIYALRKHIKTLLRLDVLCINVDDSIKSSDASPCFEDTLPLTFYPNTLLNYPYKSFDEYLQSLNSKKRRKCKLDKKTLEKEGGHLEICDDISSISSQIYALYRNTAREIKKRPNYVEMPITINEAFFSTLSVFNNLTPRLVLVKVDDVIIADALLIKSGNTLFLKAVGLDYDVSYRTKAYFNLFYATLDFATQQNCNKVDLGMTSYRFKEWLGCELNPVVYVCDVYNPLISFLDKLLVYLVERRMGTRQYSPYIS